jgi:Rrf2 family iron-sulfur cluster assembly transcriptional regulator
MLSTGCKYALQATIKIARETQGGGHCLTQTITAGTKLPPHYLAKLLQSLVRGNVLLSSKGRGGGFALRKPAREITLRHIIEAIDGPLRKYQCIFGELRCEPGSPGHPCNRIDRWREVTRSFDEFLDRTTLADLAR